MTDEQLTQIEQRAKAACHFTERWGKSAIVCTSKGGGGVLGRVWSEPNMQLWLHAATDILALVAEVRRLREELGHIRRVHAANERRNP